MAGRVLVVTGTGTGVGKTVVTAAIAALEPGRVAVLKPAQTGVAPGQDGDLAEVGRLAGPVTTSELGRFPDPLAPATAARRAGVRPVRASDVVTEAERLADEHDLVLVEGAGGLLVHFDDDGSTVADAAAAMEAPVLVVTHAGLGALNAVALTVEALRRRGVSCPGLIVGSWPAVPDLACRCNVEDLSGVTGLPLLGALPDGAGVSPDPAVSAGRVLTEGPVRDAALVRDEFAVVARRGLAPYLGGTWNATEFT